MVVYLKDFRPKEPAESKPAPETLALLIDYVAEELDTTEYKVAYDLVIAAAAWLRMQAALSPGAKRRP
jgi:hypothetical protein